MPTARPSSAVIRPSSYASESLPVAATPILGGKGVPPFKRIACACLQVGRDQQRQAGALLQPVELGRYVQGRADRDDQTRRCGANPPISCIRLKASSSNAA